DSETRVAGARIYTPMMRIETVAAGGGSVCDFDGAGFLVGPQAGGAWPGAAGRASLCHFDGARFLVGPQSAGAVPGPACYRRGGPLTVTDCNLLLGKLQPGPLTEERGPCRGETLRTHAR